MRRVLPVVVLLALSLSACGEDAGDVPAPGTSGEAPAARVEIGVTERANGGSTALKVGHGLRVELEARPETGFAWQIVEVDEAVLRAPEMEEYVPPGPKGGPGVSVWRFRAAGPGTTTLKLRYAKIGADVPMEETIYALTVIVD